MSDLHISSLGKSTEAARQRFVYGLSKVPDDRLAWSPGGSATTPLIIAGRLAGTLNYLAQLVRGSEPQRTAPAIPDTREAAAGAVEQGFAALLAALGSIGEADLGREVPTPWGTRITVAQWLNMGQQVTGYYQGQLNMIQLCYGDEDPTRPPEWTAAGR